MPYVTKPRKALRNDLWDWYEDENPQQTTVTVIEDDDARYTGLLDKDGNELVWQPERVPVGFRK